MNENAVCAVIVTFRPGPEALGNLAKVRPQVQGLVVVDNGSSEEALAPFRAASKDHDFALIENGENLGIATALNIGVRWARSQGYPFVVLFDQDSVVTDAFIENMLSKYLSHPDKESIAIVTPVHFEVGRGPSRNQTYDKDGSILVTITSGSLVPCQIFDRCGWFEDELIIDMVDMEYCLHARSLGFQILLAESATLLHRVGDPQYHYLAGRGPFRASNHSPQRRYYMTRNLIIIIVRHWKQYPEWSRGILKFLIRDAIIVCLFEKQRGRKLPNMVRGLLDAMRGRMGMVVNLSSSR
jgi:rhamnosyltransferase